MNGLCPACRRPYDEKTIEWKVVTPEEYTDPIPSGYPMMLTPLLGSRSLRPRFKKTPKRKLSNDKKKRRNERLKA